MVEPKKGYKNIGICIIPDEFDDDIKNSYMKHYVEMIVDEFLIYKKHFNISDFSYEHIVNGANEQMRLTEEEMNLVISRSKEILKNKHSIEITNDNPIEIKE